MGALKKWFKNHSHNFFFYALQQIGRRAAFFYENHNYDTESNGEERFIRALSKAKPDAQVIFDVGANVGNWSTMVRRYFPMAKIYAFEMIEGTYQRLLKNTEGRNVLCLNQGLSDQNEQKSVFSFKEGHELSTVYNFVQHGEVPSKKPVQMVTGDSFMQQNSISKIDLLKIDTEGHDLHVLKGFAKALQEKRIDVIQFEYGKINIVSKSLLYDFYQYLGSFGYVIGKIYPQSIEFKPYAYKMEDFIGPNYVGILSELASLKESLG